MSVWIVILISSLFFIGNYIIIILDQRKYKKNFPYTPYKSKKRILLRIGLGLLAGIHFIFFIGTYNHKKYNTQVNTPETLECYFGNVSQLIILIVYIFISYVLFQRIGYYYIAFLILPYITNIISLIYNKERIIL